MPDTPSLDPLRTRFEQRFGIRPRIFQAPGRVNLVGEHTDYNDGFVLPLAIDRATRVAIAPVSTPSRRMQVVSDTLNTEATFDLAHPGIAPIAGWLGYVEGMARLIEERGAHLPSAALLIESDVPQGAGLSSSAALELSSGLAFLSLVDLNLSGEELARMGQQAEWRFVGTQCGIMDQLVSALGVAGHASLIDCRTLKVETIPLKLGSATLVVCDTRAKHSLAGSEYNQRRAECALSVERLDQRTPGLVSLRDVTLDQLDDSRAELGDRLFRRAYHVVSENLRTVEAAAALRAGDLSKLGALMAASHRSLRDDYQVSAPELDAAVEAAEGVAGVYGSRMTGGGFGGSTISLVERTSVAAFERAIEKRFSERGFLAPVIREVVASDGARELL